MQSLPLNKNTGFSVFIYLLFFLFNSPLFSFQIDSLKIDQKVLVDSIKIIGNEKTKDFIILRELTFQVGDSVDNKLLHFNRERIFSLGLFNRVELGIDSLSESTIIINVEETWYIYPIPVWSLEKDALKYLTIGVNLTWNNFRGRNEVLRTIVGVGYEPYFSIAYSNPALDYNRNLGFNIGTGYYKIANKSAYAKYLVADDFNYRMFRAMFSLYKRIDQYNLVGTTFGFDYLKAETKLANLVTASKKTIDRIPFAQIYYFYDARDLKQYPKNGVFSFISFIHKGFGVNTAAYNIFQTDLRFYSELFGELIGKNRIYYRNTFGKSVPFYDYSFLGYEEKIRGYNNFYFEGKNSFLTSFELSYPVVKEWNVSMDLPLIPKSLTSARVGIYFDLFCDAGTTFNKNIDLHLNAFYTGYGAGIVFLILPFEAIRVEYAFNKFGKGELVFATKYSF